MSFYPVPLSSIVALSYWQQLRRRLLFMKDWLRTLFITNCLTNSKVFGDVHWASTSADILGGFNPVEKCIRYTWYSMSVDILDILLSHNESLYPHQKVASSKCLKPPTPAGWDKSCLFIDFLQERLLLDVFTHPVGYCTWRPAKTRDRFTKMKSGIDDMPNYSTSFYMTSVACISMGCGVMWCTAVLLHLVTLRRVVYAHVWFFANGPLVSQVHPFHIGFCPK